MTDETQQCPYCGEEILKRAKKCKYCGEWLEEKQEKISISHVIEKYINNNILNTDCIIVGNNLTNEKIKESGLSYNNDEKPLLLLYKKSLLYDLKTRILITDKKIYYKALPDSFWIGITCNFAKKIEGSFELQNIHQLSIADHDHGIGTAYIGHQLMINNTVVGLIRMGTGIEYDEKVITYLNRLFEELINPNDTQQAMTSSISLEKQEKIQNKTKDKKTDNEKSSMWSVCFKHPWISAIVIVLLINYFANIMFDIDTVKKRKDGNYCVNLKPTSADRRMFCSKKEVDIEQFKKCVNSPQLKIMYTMDQNTFGQYSQASDDSFYNACKMSTVWEQTKENISAKNKTMQEKEQDNNTEELGDIIDTYAEEENYIEEEQPKENIYKPKQESFKTKQQKTTQKNIVAPRKNPVSIQQHNKDIDDFMN